MLENVHPLLKVHIHHWRKNLKPSFEKALQAVPADKLDWAPADKMIPLGMLFLHVAETSDWWYDDIMKGKPSTEIAFMDRPCPSKEEIAGHLENHWQRMERFFAEDQSALEKYYERQGSTWKINNSGYWIFMHLFEHDVHHHSQIRHYLRILGIDPPKP